MIDKLVASGMSCSRLNFSHVSDYSEPLEKMERARAAAGRHSKIEGAMNTPPPNLRAVMVDTKGPEVRTGTLPGGAAEFEILDGSEVVLTFEDVSGEALPARGEPLRLHVDYANLPTTVSVGGTVLLDDGLITLRVVAIHNGSVKCVAENTGPIKQKKGVNLPGAILDLPALTEKDKSDLRWAVDNEADFVALSFVRSSANVRSCIAYLDRAVRNLDKGLAGRPLVISKIENAEGVENFDAILKESDGIMVARGDLGVEIDYQKVFAAQKMMVRKCNLAGKPVIVATQMLDSMIRQPRPTRAEVTDVASAVLDGADAVMLSGETAAGKYPLKALEAMQAIAIEADLIADSERPRADAPKLEGVDVELDAAARSAVTTAHDLDAKLIVCITMTGMIARAIARHRPTRPVLAFCYSKSVARKLQLLRGVHPVMLDACAADQDPYVAGTRMGVLRSESIRTAYEMGFVRPGDRVVSLDRNLGKPSDTFVIGTTMKSFTVK